MHVFQVGAGSGGMVVLDLLARDARVTKITLVEPDEYKPHNVHRHWFPSSCVGQLKADLAANWVHALRPELEVTTLPVDFTATDFQSEIESLVSRCDVGVCAVDNEPAKYHFDLLMRRYRTPWALGEVLSGGIAGWIHRFVPEGPCYGCVASHLQRNGPGDPAAPAPDYADPNGARPETTIPASKASISVVASLHALLALDLLDKPPANLPFTSLLLTLSRVPDVFEEPYRTYRFKVERSLSCLLCSAISPPQAGDDLDAAIDQALARLGHE